MTKEVLKLALEALESLIKKTSGQAIYSFMETERRIAMAACVGLREALAEPEQEPVVWMYQDKSTHEVRFQKHMRGFVDHGATYETPLYTSPPQQELVCVCGAVWEGQELIYTTPQRKPLTDEQIEALWLQNSLIQAPDRKRQAFARAIEAAHGIKE